MGNLVLDFNINDSFWNNYEKLVNKVVIPYQEMVLKDEVPGIEKSHAIDNFKAAAEVIQNGKCTDEFYGMVFQDSDVAKWLEAAAYSLSKYPDKEMEKRCDEVIDLIGRAQYPDGYLDTYFTVKMPDKKWTDLHEAHELYCAGHMIEAAVAYAECLHKTKLLDIMCKAADNIYDYFITKEAQGYPGHPEIELALMKLYRCTNNEKYKELAAYFINARGIDSDYFMKENENRDWNLWGGDGRDKEYGQFHEPVRNQKKAVGHAVRAVYLYTGMADLAQETGDEELKEACKTLWNNIINCRMYITGGIGSVVNGEAFSADYHLPNDTAYSETCASIGLIFFGKKMLDIEKNNIYADTIERALYNCVLAGMQLDGKRFFYVNPLEVIPGISGEIATERHVLPERPQWFACACCPPNVARLIGSIGNYAWSVEENIVYSHLYIGGILDLGENMNGKIEVETDYPYDNVVKYKMKPENSVMNMTLALRIPSWSENTMILYNGIGIHYKPENGYVYISESFSDNDEISLILDMKPEFNYANPKVSADSGKVAVSYGPLVYCAEGVDNGGSVLDLRISCDSELKLSVFKNTKLGGIKEIKAEGYRMKSTDELYSRKKPEYEKCSITLVPYYTWGNRGLNEMRVWIPEM